MSKHRKTSVDMYYVRKDHEWANIVHDDGLLMIHSSYGSWSYYWSHPGGPAKEFLTQLDDGYLISKLGGSKKEFDGERTEQNIRREILERRRDGRLNKDNAREIWEEIDGVDFQHEWDLHRICHAGSYATQRMLWDMEDVFFRKPDSGLEWFVRMLWPEFVAVLKAEASEGFTVDRIRS